MDLFKKCVSLDNKRVITKIYSTATSNFKEGDIVLSEGIGEEYLFYPEDYPVKDQFGFMYRLSSNLNEIEEIPLIERLPKEVLERRKIELQDRLNYFGDKVSVDEKENEKIRKEKEEIKEEIRIINNKLSE